MTPEIEESLKHIPLSKLGEIPLKENIYKLVSIVWNEGYRIATEQKNKEWNQRLRKSLYCN